jgi:alpha-L-fucosidase
LHIDASEMPKTNATDDGGMSKATTTVNGADLVRLTGGQVIDNFVDIVSKNGNMMLNVGLRADGSLPETYRHELTVIGKWLKINGEAIFRTRPFTVFGEGPFELPQKGGFNDNEFKFTAKDIRFTQSKDGKTLFIILLDWLQLNHYLCLLPEKSLNGVRMQKAFMLPCPKILLATMPMF